MKSLYGLIGYPVQHSVSPAMHNAAFKALGIDAEYRLFEVAPQVLAAFLASPEAAAIKGLNVTVPHKEKIFESVTLDPASPHLKQVRAVNTIVKKNGGWMGFNTDIPGLERHLLEQIDPRGKRIALLGAGGAGRAVAYCLAKLGAAGVSLFDTDAAKADGVLSMVRALFPGFPISRAAVISYLGISEKDILINATPVGLKESDPCLVDARDMHKNLFVYDLIYNPSQTKLLREAQKAGARVSNGLGILVYQGALSFGHFTGVDAPLDVMRAAALESLGNSSSKEHA